MKYLYASILMTLLILTSCKSDASSKSVVAEVATKTTENIKDAKDKMIDKVDEVSETAAENISAKSEELKSNIPKLKAEKPASKTEAVAESEMVSSAKEKVSTATKSAAKSYEKATKVVETKKSEIMEKTETKTSTPEKRIEPNLKVTVPIESAERKPSLDKTQYSEEVEKVDLKKNKKSNVINKPGTMNTDHSVFHNILRAHVTSDGAVDYKAIKSKSGDLDAYLTMLSKVDPSSLSVSERLAFWINAYNAATIKKIVDNYPVKSIKDLNGGKPWDDKFVKLDGKTMSLNEIENGIIRPEFKEPRIHFAVNCAAKSCPPIHNGAYSAGNLNTNFENSAKAFINNPKYNQISADKVVISNIFNWYGEDFGNIIDYLNKYSDTKINSNAKVEYLDYDWSLNGK